MHNEDAYDDRRGELNGNPGHAMYASLIWPAQLQIGRDTDGDRNGEHNAADDKIGSPGHRLQLANVMAPEIKRRRPYRPVLY